MVETTAATTAAATVTTASAGISTAVSTSASTATTTSVSTNLLHVVPTLPIFSGTEPDPTSAYEIWQFTILSLMDEGYPEPNLWQAIRKSLRGDGAQSLINFQTCGMGHGIQDFVAYMSVTYGAVAPASTLLQQFFSASQGESETVTSWSSRLQGLYRRAVVAQEHTFHPMHRNSDMKSRFWQGLRDTRLQDTLRQDKDDSGIFFEQLVLKARMLEQEFQASASTSSRSKVRPVASIQAPSYTQLATPTTTSPPIQVTPKTNVKSVASAASGTESATVMELRKRIEQLEKQVAKGNDQSGHAQPRGPFTWNQVSTPRSYNFRPRYGYSCFYCGQEDHFIRTCPHKQQSASQPHYAMNSQQQSQIRYDQGNWRGPRQRTNPWAQWQ
jgi:hypothetical protein